jgi:glycosyltransferase involved in cell wall biosynthesis
MGRHGRFHEPFLCGGDGVKILVALSRFPWPLEKGDKLRAYYQLQGLARSHEVHLVCLNDRAIHPDHLKKLSFCQSVQIVVLPKWRSLLNLLGGLFDKRPFQVHYFRSSKFKQLLSHQIQTLGAEALYVQLIRMGLNLPEGQHPGRYLDYMDTFSIGMENRAKHGNFITRTLARLEAKRLKSYEAELASHFQGWSVISDRDLAALPDNIRNHTDVIPNGVGEYFFEDIPKPERKYDLVFFGNLGYQPNVESAKFLMESILPVLRSRGRNLRVCLAGARPAGSILKYQSEWVQVTGFVEDIRVPVLQSRIAVAPVVGGQGLQNKLLESMALGVPTITTPLAHAGLVTSHEEELLVCNTPAQFADAIERLLDNPVLAETIGAKGRKFVEQNYRWDTMNKRLETGLLRVARGLTT